MSADHASVIRDVQGRVGRSSKPRKWAYEAPGSVIPLNCASGLASLPPLKAIRLLGVPFRARSRWSSRTHARCSDRTPRGPRGTRLPAPQPPAAACASRCRDASTRAAPPVSIRPQIWSKTFLRDEARGKARAEAHGDEEKLGHGRCIPDGETGSRGRLPWPCPGRRTGTAGALKRRCPSGHCGFESHPGHWASAGMAQLLPCYGVAGAGNPTWKLRLFNTPRAFPRWLDDRRCSVFRATSGWSP